MFIEKNYASWQILLDYMTEKNFLDQEIPVPVLSFSSGTDEKTPNTPYITQSINTLPVSSAHVELPLTSFKNNVEQDLTKMTEVLIKAHPTLKWTLYLGYNQDKTITLCLEGKKGTVHDKTFIWTASKSKDIFNKLAEHTSSWFVS
jgi:hypothetical protein